MITFILLIITVSSFLFYGVVGADKTGLLAPVFLLGYTTITIALLKRSAQLFGKSAKPVPFLPPSGLLWVIFVLYGVGLISTAAVPFESKLVMLFIGGVVGAFMVWGGELTSFKDNRMVLGGLIFMVMISALYGLIIHFKNPDFVLWTERYAVYEGRLMSTYICPNHFAHLMQMLLPFCLVLLFIPQSGIYLRILAGYSFLVFLPPLYLTESRAGWLGSIAAIGITVCLMALRRSKKLFVLLVVLVPLCSALLLLGGWRYSETFQRRMQPVVTFLEGQAEGGIGSASRDFRPQTWMDTVDMIKEQPLFGFGPGNYRYTFPEYRNRFQGQRIVTGHPHNEYLELMADYGLIGFGVFAVAWIYGLFRILRFSLKTSNQHHAFVAMAFLGTAVGTMVHSFFDFQMHVFPNALVFALLAALAVGPLRREASGKKSTRRGVHGDENKRLAIPSELLVSTLSTSTPRQSPRWFTRAFAGLLSLGFLVGTFFCLQIMSSSFIRALGDRAAGQAVGHSAMELRPSAKGFYTLAVKIDPQNWRAYKGMALLLHEDRYYAIDRSEKGALAMVERAWYEKAYACNPKDAEVVSGLGKVLVFLGRQQANDPLGTTGLQLLREACSYRKFNDIYWWTLGVELRKAERYGEALEVFQYAEKIRRSPSTRKNIQWLEKQLASPGLITEKIKREEFVPASLQKSEIIDLSGLLEMMGE